MSYKPLSFGTGGNVTFGLTGSQITASAPGGGGGGGVALSASGGSISNGTAVFSNANGVTFGMAGSTVTASHNGLTSQSAQAFNASGGSSAFQTLSFNNANGLTFSNNAGAIEASYTVPSTAGLLSAVKVSAGTSSANLSALTFANSNGVTFGLSGSQITAQYSQSAQAFSASNGFQTFQVLEFLNSNGVSWATQTSPSGSGGIVASYTVPSTAGLLSAVRLSAGTSSANLSAVTFSNSNGVSFGLNGSVVTGSHNGLTSQSNQAVSAANGSSTFQTLSFANSNGVSFSTGTQGLFASYTVPSTAGLLSAINVSAGTTSNNLSALTFSNGSGVSFGLNGSVVTGSIASSLTNINISAGTTSQNLSALTFSNLNGVSFGLNGSVVTASVAGGGGLTNINVSAGTTSQNLSALTFSNLNGVTFGLNGSTITASVAAAGGGGAFVRNYPELPHAWATSSMYTGASTTVGGGSQSTLSFYLAPLVLNVGVSYSNVGAIIQPGATIAGTGSGTHRHVLGIYQRVGNTLTQVTGFGWNAVHSQSSVTAQTLSWWAGDFAGSTAATTSRISGNVSASITGVKQIWLNASTSSNSLSAGGYYLAHGYNFRSSSSALFNMGTAWRHSVSQFTGAFGFSNTSGPSYDDLNGIFSTVVTAANQFEFNAPSSINVTAITGTGGSSQNQWPLVILKSP
jgi:hypothetical protein